MTRYEIKVSGFKDNMLSVSGDSLAREDPKPDIARNYRIVSGNCLEAQQHALERARSDSIFYPFIDVCDPAI